MRTLGRLIGGLLLAAVAAGAAARPLSEAEQATLRAYTPAQGSPGWQAADRLALALAREGNLDALPALVGLHDGIIMNQYVQSLSGPRTATPAIEALALQVARDPSFERDFSSRSARSQLFRLLPNYQSRELFDVFYASRRRALIERAGQQAAGGEMPWELHGSITPRDMPGIEAPLAALLPLIDDACRGVDVISLLRDRRYAPAFERMRALYLRSGVSSQYCIGNLSSYFAQLATRPAVETLAERVRWLAAQPAGSARDEELISDFSQLGANPIEAQIDLDALARELRAQPLDAALRGRFELAFQAQKALAQKAEEPSGEHLLYWIMANRPEIARSLIEHGAGVSERAPRGQTPLEAVVSHAGMYRTVQDPLADAYLQLAQLLIARGADVAAADLSGMTPLHHAAQAGSQAMIELLVAHGAPLAAVDRRGFTPLHYAAENGQVAAIEALLAHGAAINAGKVADHVGAGPVSADDPAIGSTPLHVAVSTAQTEAVLALLAHGASINAVTSNGTTPLMNAVNTGRLPLVKLLVEHGARVSQEADGGISAIVIAHEQSHPEIEDYLRSKGAFLNPLVVAKEDLIRAFVTAMFSGMH